MHIEHKQRSHHEFISHLCKKAKSRGRPRAITTVVSVVHRRGQVILGEKVVRALPITRDRHVCVCVCARTHLWNAENVQLVCKQANKQARKKHLLSTKRPHTYARARTLARSKVQRGARAHFAPARWWPLPFWVCCCCCYWC